MITVYCDNGILGLRFILSMHAPILEFALHINKNDYISQQWLYSLPFVSERNISSLFVNLI